MLETLLGFPNDLSKIHAIDVGFLVAGLFLRAAIGEWVKDEAFPFAKTKLIPVVNKEVKIMAQTTTTKTAKVATTQEVLGWASKSGLKTSEVQLLIVSSLFLIINDGLDIYNQVHVDPSISIWVFAGTIAYAIVRTFLKLVSIWKISLPDNVVAALHALLETPLTVETTPTNDVVNQVETTQAPLAAEVPLGFNLQPTEPPVAPFTASDVVIE